tara:strand:+ start:36 stop:851 length:816 start_codon:yes stop_codon:yes gene_type:complete
MKTIKLIPIILSLLFSYNSEAQLLKKLKKKASEAAERSIERKVEEKTEKETEKAFDSVFNNKGRLFKKEKAKPADYYSFSHKYVMQINDSKNPTNMNYYLTDQGGYIGSSMDLNENEEMTTVMDISNQTAHLFMNMGGKKSTMSFTLDFEETIESASETTDVEIEETGKTKVIIGYNCNEYNVKGKDFHGSVWVTDEADASFGGSFYKMKSKKFKTLKNMDQSWLATIEGLVMETNITDTSRKKPKSITMTCIAFDAVEYVIETAEFTKTF